MRGALPVLAFVFFVCKPEAMAYVVAAAAGVWIVVEFVAAVVRSCE